MSFQLKQLVAHDKLDLLDLDHIISENKYVTTIDKYLKNLIYNFCVDTWQRG